MAIIDRAGACVALAVALLIGAASTARAAGVVGTGTAASCTDAALDAALAGGGLVTFNCGGPAIIDISSGTGTKTITADTTIDGGGLITISGGHSVRVFSVNDGVNFTVQNLTIAAGNIILGYGGGIENFGTGTVTVTNSTFSGNNATAGGGIDNGGGTLTVTNSTFSGNSAVGGGGIFNNGTLTVTNSTFTGNSTNSSNFGGGGGIANDGTLTVTNSTFTGNSADGGGGILNETGGTGTVTITNSTFSDNNAADGGGIENFGMVTVTNNTFSNNRAFFGGGIANDGSTLTVTNSTFSGNNAVDGGGGIINFNHGTLTVTNSTFSGNSAVGGGGIDNDSHLGSEGGTLTVTNTIVANSTSGGNCFGSVTDGGHNIDDGTTCGFMGTGCTSTSGSSFCSTNPQLDPTGLANNGGPTQTIALQAGSPAVNAGNESVCAAPAVNNLDQRGHVRPGDGATSCSIGAYEADSTASEACGGDCDGTHTVAVNNLITLVNIALGTAQPSACPNGIPNGVEVTVALIIQAVNNALNGCSG